MKDYIHKEFPKTCAPDDFFGQVKRTVHGKPVSEEQIAMIVAAIRQGLNLRSKDVLLDLGCGNGALSRYLFPDISGFQGVDFSEFLVDVAKKHFEKLPDYRFDLAEVPQYVANCKRPDRFSKVLCYGVFSYLSDTDVIATLDCLRSRFTGVRKFYIGNLPDRDRAANFFDDKDYEPLLDVRDSPLGIWRSKEDIRKLARSAGWSAEFSLMPKEFYAAHYRMDAVLVPSCGGSSA